MKKSLTNQQILDKIAILLPKTNLLKQVVPLDKGGGQGYSLDELRKATDAFREIEAYEQLLRP